MIHNIKTTVKTQVNKAGFTLHRAKDPIPIFFLSSGTEP